MKINQIKTLIIEAMSKRCGFELSASTKIEHFYLMSVKLGHSTPEEAAICIENDCTVTFN